MRCAPGQDAGPALEVWTRDGPQAEAVVAQLREAVLPPAAGDADEDRGDPESVTVTVEVVDETELGDRVRDAAVAGRLPDLFEVDGPNLYPLAGAGVVRPLDGCVDSVRVTGLLDAVREQGTLGGVAYGVGQGDAVVGLYARASALREAGVRVPTGAQDAWTVEEFGDVLRALREAGFEAPLDLGAGDGQEWLTTAFAPVLASGGARVLGLDGSAALGDSAVEALQVVAAWVSDGLVDPDPDRGAFTAGDTALSLNGTWAYEAYVDAHGEDVVVLPPVDFGRGVRVGHGSWQWAVAAASDRPDAAGALLDTLLEPEHMAQVAEATGGVPADPRVLGDTVLYGTDGRLRVLAELLRDGRFTSRPRTAVYPEVSAAVAGAVAATLDGRPVGPAVGAAERRIDRAVRAGEASEPTG